MNNVKWYIIAGAVLGVLGATLVHFGNPDNMGVCVACFLRDTTGALGFHRAAAVQYIRPEIIGLVFGGFLASVLWTREFAPVTGNSPFAKFFLGIFDRLPCIFGMPVARVFAPRRRRFDRASRVSGSDLRRTHWVFA